ncbi:MAG: A/G-specific adenine glycosylase [Patescibacteria group bacterium]
MSVKKKVKIHSFKKEIWRYYKMYGREMPWRHNPDPYAVLISEIMLQQTQVDRVRPKWEAFLKQFPDFSALAQASSADVIRAWQGLGYNRRALGLKRLAEIVVLDHQGKLPSDSVVLETLPGIGPATAGSLAAFAFNLPAPFIETNIRRVYIYFFFPRAKKVKDSDILKLVGETIDKKNPREWFYALMDHGAFLAKKVPNPNRKSKTYTKQSPFVGSRRQIRGALLRALSLSPMLSLEELSRATDFPVDTIAEVSRLLEKEGFLKEMPEGYTLV